jgi:predicted MPP superfamily phosphohydrolase
MKFLIRIIAAVVSIITITVLFTIWELPSSHEQTPYIKTRQAGLTPTSPLIHRVILFGDAGASSLEPFQPSLSIALRRAKLLPQHTTILALGDNIYPDGYPVLAAGQKDYHPEQLEDIAHLNAQLEVAKRSGAEMFVVPGNHDWVPNQVQDQADHIEQFSTRSAVNIALMPYRKGQPPHPQMVHRVGISFLFIDSLWLIKTSQNELEHATTHMQNLLALTRSERPDNIIIIAAHHPIESMGPHNTGFGTLGRIIKWGVDSFTDYRFVNDLTDPPYVRYIEAIGRSSKDHGKVIFAGGHDHSLQLFESSTSPQYRLVSGSANASKVSRVSHNDNSLFSHAAEGLMELEIYEEGALLSIHRIDTNQPAYSHWLWRTSQ